MSQVDVREMTNREEWEDFLLKRNFNTFLHSWEWGEVQVATGERIKRLGVYFEDVLVEAVLVIVVNARRGKHYLIPHGPLADKKIGTGEFLSVIIDRLKDMAKEEDVVAIRVAPLMINNEKNREILKELGFRGAPMHVHTELTWVLNISKDIETIFSGMRKTTRGAIKKARRVGVEAEVVDGKEGLSRFLPLYDETKTRHGFVPFSNKVLETQIELFSEKNRIFAVVASYEGEDVAAAILVHYGKTVFYYHGASKKLSSSVPASQLVQWRAIKEAKKRGATKYNFWGIAPADKPKHPFAGITVFKKGFGGYAIDYMHAQDLPLSPAYLKLWLVEMWRKRRRGF